MSFNQYVVDRIEGDYLVIVDDSGNVQNIQKVSEDLKEGDILIKTNSGYEKTNDKAIGLLENKVKGMWVK